MNRPSPPTSSSPRAEATDPWSWRPPRPMRIERQVGLLRIDGPDTLRFLHGQTSQDLQQARPNQRLATCCLTPTGRLRALAEVLVDGEGAWLVITSGDGEAVRAALDRVLFPADDVRLGALGGALLVEPLESEALPAPPELRGSWTSRAEGGWWLGERLLLAEGGSLPADLARRPVLEPWAAELQRIRMGVPAVPGEISDGTNPFELGLADRVSLTKGCYVGQETLARLATYDGVRQQLRRWALSPDSPGSHGEIAPGATLRTPEGERAGIVTSVLRLPETVGPPVGPGGWMVGLALVRRMALEPGELCVEAGADRPTVAISLPAAFVAPPVGGGRQPGGGDAAS